MFRGGGGGGGGGIDGGSDEPLGLFIESVYARNYRQKALAS